MNVDVRAQEILLRKRFCSVLSDCRPRHARTTPAIWRDTVFVRGQAEHRSVKLRTLLLQGTLTVVVYVLLFGTLFPALWSKRQHFRTNHAQPPLWRRQLLRLIRTLLQNYLWRRACNLTLFSSCLLHCVCASQRDNAQLLLVHFSSRSRVWPCNRDDFYLIRRRLSFDRVSAS